MLKLLAAGLFAVLTCFNGAAHAQGHQVLNFTGSDFGGGFYDPTPYSSISGQFVYTTGEQWTDPAQLLSATLVIDGYAFTDVQMFHGPSFTTFSQGDVNNPGNSFYFDYHGDWATFMFRMAGSDIIWGAWEMKLDHQYVSAAQPLSNVLAVPEPQTYAMLLAGLAVLGFAARRRRA